MISARGMRHGAADAAARLPALLAAAEPLAASMVLGAHGRRRSGHGEEFWQFRPAVEGDEARAIDWRRSAQSDVSYVREREWQTAQNVQIWTDRSQSMGFDSHGQSKGDRAAIISLALAMVLVRGGERVGLTGTRLPPRTGNPQVLRLAEMFCQDDDTDYSPPEHRAMIPHARAVFISDFMGELDGVQTALTKAADRGVRGVIYHVLDPSEEVFPFTGRTIFESVGGTLRHETLKANDLKGRYLARLAERKAELQRLCALTGWQYGLHHTNSSAQSALLWLYGALDARAGVAA